MTARDVLAEIEQRTGLAKRDESLIWLGDHDEALKLAIPEARQHLIENDALAMAAALRAVLDNHWCIEGGEECGYDGRFWPCPDYRNVRDALGTT